MVVVAALVERTYVANLGLLVENPAESVACAVYTTYVMFCTGDVVALENSVASLFCQSVNFLGILASQERREVREGLVIGLLRELNCTLNYSNIILFNGVASLQYVDYQNTLAIKNQFLKAASRSRCDGLDDLFVSVIDVHALILS